MQLNPTSLIGVASKVHSLLRKYDALVYFRDRVREAAREYIAAVTECERREKLRRDTVAKDGVLCLPLDDEVVKEKTKDRYFFWSEEFRGRIKLPQEVTEPLMPLTHGAQFPNRPAVPRCLSNGIDRDDWSENAEREVDEFNKELTDWDKKRSDYVTATKEGGPSKWEEDKHRIFELAKKRSFPDDGDDGLPFVFRVEAFLPDKLSEDRDPPTAPLPVPETEKTLSTNFKYAGLAAIYDAHWGSSERIAPWDVVKSGGKVSPASGLPSEWKTPEEPGSYRAASWYWRLVNSAKDLDERNTTIVDSWLADVESDLSENAVSPVALTPEERTILEVLADESPMTVTQEALAGQTCLSDRTVRKYVGELRERGLVDQPRGPKKGFAITLAAMKAIGRE
jgi:hypothetical protein